jgi:hypothetical protein
LNASRAVSIIQTALLVILSQWFVVECILLQVLQQSTAIPALKLTSTWAFYFSRETDI